MGKSKMPIAETSAEFGSPTLTQNVRRVWNTPEVIEMELTLTEAVGSVNHIDNGTSV